MDKKETNALQTLLIVAGVLATLAVAVAVLYRTERRVRRLFHLAEQRLRTKPASFEVDL